jgi:uncharacterized protein YdcH (DUF465 family)
MKQNKNFCLEYDLIEKLKQEDNASELISTLLYKHYASINPDEREEQLKQEMAKFERAKKEYDRLQKAKQELENNKKATQKQKEDLAKQDLEYKRQMQEWAKKEGLI